MSRASEASRALMSARKNWPEPLLIMHCGSWALKAAVADNGCLIIDRNTYETLPEDALALANWILESFGEEAPNTPR